MSFAILKQALKTLGKAEIAKLAADADFIAHFKGGSLKDWAKNSGEDIAKWSKSDRVIFDRMDAASKYIADPSNLAKDPKVFTDGLVEVMGEDMAKHADLREMIVLEAASARREAAVLTRGDVRVEVIGMKVKMMAAAAVGIGSLATYENVSGGQLSGAAIDGTAAMLTAIYGTIKEEDRQEWLAKRLENLETLTETFSLNIFNKVGLNGAVKLAQTNSTNPSDWKAAAVGYLLVTDGPKLLGKMELRSAVYKKFYTDLSDDERDYKVAEGIIDDIVHGAKSAALGEHQITREDVGTWLKNNPNKFTHAPESVRNGLIQIYPELQTIEAPSLKDQAQGAFNDKIKGKIPSISFPDMSAGTLAMGSAALFAVSQAFSGDVKKIGIVIGVIGLVAAAVKLLSTFNPKSGADGGENAPNVQVDAPDGTLRAEMGGATVKHPSYGVPLNGSLAPNDKIATPAHLIREVP